MLDISMLLDESMMYTDANHNGLHTGTDKSEITKSGFVWFCKKAPQMLTPKWPIAQPAASKRSAPN